MATSTASGHHVVDLFDATACPAEIVACSWALMGGNGIRLQRTSPPGTHEPGHNVNRVTEAQALPTGHALTRKEPRCYFLETDPLRITVLDGVSGFMLSSAVMKISKSL